ncbi:hypothetical protein Bbelb_194870 [Branchiostoma belcheri]|nr:hypothetical protein Bbelb_194870 [Branchiostoma belcheri]
MGRKLRHILIFLLIILKEPNMPKGDDICAPSSRGRCPNLGLTKIPQNLPTFIYQLDLKGNGMLVSMPSLYIDNNPWRCDCKMAPFWKTMIETPAVLKQITCAQPANLSGQKLKDVSLDDLICKDSTKSTPTFGNTESCYNGTITSHYHWYFKRNADPTVDTEWKRLTTSTLAATGTFNESGPSLPLVPAVISASLVFLVLLALGFIIWCKKGGRNPDSGSNFNSALRNTMTTVVKVTNNQYEDKNQNDQTGQGQSQALTEPNTASGQDHQYEDIDNLHVKTGQGQSQTNTERNTNTTAIVVASGQDNQCDDIDNRHVKTRQGQSHAYINTTTDVTTGKVQSQAITESEKVRNPTGPAAMQSYLYEDMGPPIPTRNHKGSA